MEKTRKGCALDLPLQAFINSMLHALRKELPTDFIAAFDLTFFLLRLAAPAEVIGVGSLNDFEVGGSLSAAAAAERRQK